MEVCQTQNTTSKC